MPPPVYFNDPCCCDHEKQDPSEPVRGLIGDLQGPADIEQPDWIPTCAGEGLYLSAANPMPSESWVS